MKNAMEHVHATILRFISLSQWLLTDLIRGPHDSTDVREQPEPGFLPDDTFSSSGPAGEGLIAGQILPLSKLISGSVLVLLVSW